MIKEPDYCCASRNFLQFESLQVCKRAAVNCQLQRQCHWYWCRPPEAVRLHICPRFPPFPG